MNFLTATILGGITYDILKNGLKITTDTLKSKLQDWLITDEIIQETVSQIEILKLNDEMSEKAIERKIDSSIELVEILKRIQSKEQVIITQTHNGNGDNIGVQNNN